MSGLHIQGQEQDLGAGVLWVALGCILYLPGTQHCLDTATVSHVKEIPTVCLPFESYKENTRRGLSMASKAGVSNIPLSRAETPGQSGIRPLTRVFLTFLASIQGPELAPNPNSTLSLLSSPM